MSNSDTQKKHVKILVVASTPMTLQFFMMEQLAKLAEKYDVSIASNWPDQKLRTEFETKLATKTIHINIKREICIGRDIVSLLQLIFICCKLRPTIIHSITPKAGLLSSIAGLLCFVPCRIHTFTGQVWATASGMKRKILAFMDGIIGHCATDILIDSNTQREFLLANHIIRKGNSQVLGYGSVSGVNLQKFKPCSVEEKELRRQQLNLKSDDIVAIFIGRKKNDKGLNELLAAWSEVSPGNPKLKLLLVGPDEDDFTQKINAISAMLNGSIVNIDRVNDPEKYMQLADFFCLPSHREGFGSVLIEAGAVKLPALASDIYGIQDAVISEVTGILHPVGDKNAIAAGIKKLAENPALCADLGQAAYIRVCKEFDSNLLLNELLTFYNRKVTALSHHK